MGREIRVQQFNRVLYEKDSQLGAGCGGSVHHQVANGEALKLNNRTIIDVCISTVSKNVTINFIKNTIILNRIKPLKKWIKIIHCTQYEKGQTAIQS